jgi:hypothetical protein
MRRISVRQLRGARREIMTPPTRSLRHALLTLVVALHLPGGACNSGVSGAPDGANGDGPSDAGADGPVRDAASTDLPGHPGDRGGAGDRADLRDAAATDADAMADQADASPGDAPADAPSDAPPDVLADGSADAPDLDCSINLSFGSYLPLLVASGAAINTQADETGPSVAGDGTVYFARSGSLMVATSRGDGTYDSPALVPLPVESGAVDRDPEVSADQRTLHFAARGRSGATDFDIFRGTRSDATSPFTVQPVRTAVGDDLGPAVDESGTTFLLSRAGDIFMTGNGFGGSLQSLPQVNTTSSEDGPTVRGNLVIFASDRPQAGVNAGRFRPYAARLDCPGQPATRIVFPNEFADDDIRDPYLAADGSLYLSIQQVNQLDLFRASPL